MKKKTRKIKIVLERPKICVGNEPLKNANMSYDPNFNLAIAIASATLKNVNSKSYRNSSK